MPLHAIYSGCERDINRFAIRTTEKDIERLREHLAHLKLRQKILDQRDDRKEADRG